MKKLLLLGLVVFGVIPLLLPIFQNGFWSSDDGTWMIIRLAGFYDTLVKGQFPVRFIYSLNHGFGYPVTNFLYPLPFYLGSVIHLVGFNFVDSVKILFGLAIVLSALFMYLFVSSEWGGKAGLIAAFFYSYAPYKIFDIYTRGSLGESVAFIFPPLIFYLLNKNRIVFAILAIAGLICSHNVIALLFLPFIFLYMLTKFSLKVSAICYLLAAMVSSWFWFPALYDLQFTKAGQTVVSNFRDYWITSKNFWQILGPAIPLIILTSLSRVNKKFTLLLIVTFVSLFFALPVSEIFWTNLPLARLVQFPWRFLSVTIFGSAVLAGYLFRNSKNYVIGIIIVLCGLVSVPSFTINRTFYPQEYYVTNDDTTTVKNEYMPKWVKPVISQRSEVKSQKLENGKTEIFTVYFPGIKVLADEKEISVKPSENGYLLVNSQSDNLKILFGETWWRLAADLVSIGAILLLVFYRKWMPTLIVGS